MHGASKTRAASSPALLSLSSPLSLALLPHRRSAPEMLSSAFFLPLLAVLASAAPTPGGGEGREFSPLSRLRTSSGPLHTDSGLTLDLLLGHAQPASTSSSRATSRRTNSRPRSRSRRSATGTSTPTSVSHLSRFFFFAVSRERRADSCFRTRREQPSTRSSSRKRFSPRTVSPSAVSSVRLRVLLLMTAHSQGPERLPV